MSLESKSLRDICSFQELAGECQLEVVEYQCSADSLGRNVPESESSVIRDSDCHKATAYFKYTVQIMLGLLAQE